MINVDSLITDLKCLGEVAETEDILVEGNPLHAWVNESWQALESLQQQLADTQRKLEEAEKAVVAMVEDGWLMHGPEGMSEPQQLAFDVYQSIEQSKGGDDD